MQLTPKAICAAVALLCIGSASFAQSADPLREAAQKAVQTNPEVTARFNAYRAAGDAVQAVIAEHRNLRPEASSRSA